MTFKICYVCQLHYASGGFVHTTSRGASVSLPFQKAPFLQVGQRVDFSISRSFGFDEAVDLQLVQAQSSNPGFWIIVQTLSL